MTHGHRQHPAYRAPPHGFGTGQPRFRLWPPFEGLGGWLSKILVMGVADLGPDEGEPAITETLSFFETFGYHATSVTVAAGTFDVDGRSPGLVVYVHRDNPIARLTMKQLDGIFGAKRNGGLSGFKWIVKAERGADQNLRTWGGPTSQFRPMATRLSGTSRFFQFEGAAK